MRKKLVPSQFFFQFTCKLQSTSPVSSVGRAHFHSDYNVILSLPVSSLSFSLLLRNLLSQPDMAQTDADHGPEVDMDHDSASTSAGTSCPLPKKQKRSCSDAAPTSEPVPTPPATNEPSPSTRRVVLIDNIAGNGFSTRKEVERELLRVAPWLQARSISFLRRGGLRIQCFTPEDALKLISRTAWPTDAWKENPSKPSTRVRVHFPGNIDPNNSPVTSPNAGSSRRDPTEDRRTVLVSSIPREWSNSEIAEALGPNIISAIRTVGDKVPSRPPLRAIVFVDASKCDAAIKEGLRFMNRIINCRKCHPRPTPTRCHRCQAIEAHSTFDCPAPGPTCASCAGPHFTGQCQDENANHQCCRCGGSHSAAFLSCEKAREAAKKARDTRIANAPPAPAPPPLTRPKTTRITSPGYQQSAWPPLPSAAAVPPAPPAINTSTLEALIPLLPQLIASLASIQSFMERIEARLPMPPVLVPPPQAPTSNRE